MTEELLEAYEIKKRDIKKRLEEFRNIFNQPDEKLFKELAFCICTPGSRAKRAWDAVEKLENKNLLLKGTENQIRPFLNTVRFNKEKAKRIVKNRNFFTVNGRLKIKEKIMEYKDDPFALRKWLKENIDGYGMKESSHFIRNIGLSNNQLAILDVHILKNLKNLGVIDEIPKYQPTGKQYLEIEEKMKKITGELGITLDELDLLLWSKETGIVFK